MSGEGQDFGKVIAVAGAGVVNGSCDIGKSRYGCVRCGVLDSLSVQSATPTLCPASPSAAENPA